MVSRATGGFAGGDAGLLTWWGTGVDFWLWIVDVEFGTGVYWVVHWYTGWMALRVLPAPDCRARDCAPAGTDACNERGRTHYRRRLLTARRDAGAGTNPVVEARDDYWLLFANLVLAWFWWWMHSKRHCVYYGLATFRIWIWHLRLGYCAVDCGGERSAGNQRTILVFTGTGAY